MPTLKILSLLMILMAFSGCASNTGGSDWDEWTSRLKKEAPATTRAQGQVDNTY